LDTLEEQITLFIQEYNFRKILEDHTLKLLRYKKEYWKKRYTVRWTKRGDEGTKFFHVAATERYRLNAITDLISEDGNVSDHNEEVALLLEDLRKRMGCTTNTTMLYYLSQLVQPGENIENLSEPFSIHDIDKVIKQMPTDKARP
jgi:CRISPR/Cas system Type II protein with McrA/HNH and RuvC-like nuclease domain